ncbi:MAG: NUDIX hydrolase, partial [Pseudomonadales bacterium]|nr:NUDIX hydrolase [Pseudomonadales bacterium]
MNYCSQCAAPLTRVIPDGDDRLRHVCTACRHVHYQNPRVVTGTLPVHGERVLLCKRAIAPRLG